MYAKEYAANINSVNNSTVKNPTINELHAKLAPEQNQTDVALEKKKMTMMKALIQEERLPTARSPPNERSIFGGVQPKTSPFSTRHLIRNIKPPRIAKGQKGKI